MLDRQRVDPAVCLLEATGTVAGEPIQAAATDRGGLEPALTREAEHARAHQPFVDAKRREQPDQSRQQDGAAVGGDRVTPDRDDERRGARGR